MYFYFIRNIFIFGIKPTNPSSEYGYFLTKKIKGNFSKVTKFIEKPKYSKAKQSTFWIVKKITIISMNLW